MNHMGKKKRKVMNAYVSPMLNNNMERDAIINVAPPPIKTGFIAHTYFEELPKKMKPNNTKPPAPTPTPAAASQAQRKEPKPITKFVDDPVDITMEMQDLLHDILELLIDDSESVTITNARSVNKTIFSVVVPPREMGKVIGKQGVIIKSLTSIFKAMGSKYDKVVEIELVEPRKADQKA